MPQAVSYSWSDIVGLIQSEGTSSGLSTDQINAAIAVARAEGGWTGALGDNGTSFGVFQFHFGGILDSFATWLGQTRDQAGSTAILFPQLAIHYALGQGGYLYNALVAGKAAGKSGADLASYAQEKGQGSAAGTGKAAAAWWDNLFGGGKVVGGPLPDPFKSPLPGGLPPLPNPSPAPAIDTTLPQVQLPAKSTLPVIGPMLDAFNFAGASIQAAVLSLERFFWIVIGLLLGAIGLWILVKAEGR